MLNEILDSSLHNTRCLLSEDEDILSVYEDMDRFIKTSFLSDKKKLFDMSNYELLCIFINYFNIDKMNHRQIERILDESRSIVNSWTDKETKYLESIAASDNLNMMKMANAIEGLHLNPEVSYLELRVPFRLMSNILLFRKNVNGLSSSSIMFKGSKLYSVAFKDTDIEVLTKLLRDDCDNSIKNIKYEIEVLELRLKYTKEIEDLFIDGDIYDLKEIKSEWHKYLDRELLSEIYSILLNNQRDSYREVMDVNNSLKSVINKTPLVSFLYNNGLNPRLLGDSLDALNSIPFDILKERIDFLLSLHVSIIDIFTKYIDYLFKLENVTIPKLTMFVNKNIIKKETILRDVSVLDKFNIISTNYDILSTLIRFTNPFYKDSILLIDPKELRLRISILKEYDINENESIFLLCNFEYMYVLDLMLEENIPDYLLISICKSDDPLLTIKKIIISREINEPYLSKNNMLKKEVCKKGYFLCRDEEIDSYLNRTEFKSNLKDGNIENISRYEVVSWLDENFRCGNVYVFNKTKISRGKVLKYLSGLKKIGLSMNDYLYSCIVNDSLLTDFDLLNIKSTLSRHNTFA